MQANKWVRPGFTGLFADTLEAAERMLQDALDNGGGTYTDKGRTEFDGTSGYVVGGSDWAPGLILPAHCDTSSSLAELAAWLQRLPSRGDGSPVHIGVWRDSLGDERVYVDCVDILPDIDRAMDLARDRGELSIYDLCEREVIETGVR